MRRSSYAIATVLLAALLFPSGSHATSFATKMSLKELVEQSDFVFSGKVETLTAEQDEVGQIWTLYTFGNVQPIVGSSDSGDTFSLRCMGFAPLTCSTGMKSASEQLLTGTRINPIQPQNQVKTVTKMESGDLHVVLHSGQSYTLDKGDELFQTFVVWAMLNKGF